MSVGLMTCYDLRFPELPRALSRAGASCCRAVGVGRRAAQGAPLAHAGRPPARSRTSRSSPRSASPRPATPATRCSSTRAGTWSRGRGRTTRWSSASCPGAARGGPGGEPVVAEPRDASLAVGDVNARVTGRGLASGPWLASRGRSTSWPRWSPTSSRCTSGRATRSPPGDTVVLLESMKMEIPVLAEHAGTVTAVNVGAGRRRPGGRRRWSPSTRPEPATLDSAGVARPGTPGGPRRGAGVAYRNRLESGRWQ